MQLKQLCKHACLDVSVPKVLQDHCLKRDIFTVFPMLQAGRCQFLCWKLINRGLTTCILTHKNIYRNMQENPIQNKYKI